MTQMIRALYTDMKEIIKRTGITGRKQSVVKRWLTHPLMGPSFALFVLIITIILFKEKKLFFDLTGIFVILIIYSIFTGGLKSGLISFGMSNVYIIELLYIYAQRHNFQQLAYIAAVGINDIILVVGALMVGYMYERLKSSNKALYKYKMCLNRTEEISQVMTVHIDVNGRILKVPPRFCSLLDYTAQELLDMRFQEITYPEDIKEEKEKLKEMLEGKYLSYDMEKRFMAKNGRIFWTYVNVLMISEESGMPMHLLAYVKDITERKRAEEALAESERRLRQITDNMLDVISQTNDKGILMYSSPSLKSILGYNPEERIGKSIFEFVHPEDIDQVKTIFEACMCVSSSGKAEFRYKHAKGYYMWLESVGNLLYNDKEEIIGAIFSTRDITERKIAEKALKESREQYRRFVEYSPDAIVVHDDSVILFANEAAAKLAGLRVPKELIGRKLIDFVHYDQKQDVTEQIRALLNKNMSVSLREEQIITIDHKTIDVELVGIPFVYKGKSAFQVTIRDITDRKKAEILQRNVEESKRLLKEVKEYEKLRDDFFANISHELRTPLNVILGILQLLNLFAQDRLCANNNQSTMKHIAVMRQNCYRLLRLVNNLIDITKIDAGFFQLHLKNVNIVSIIEDITLSVAEYIQSKGIMLQFDTDIEEKILACDPDKMERIMLNLLSNAIKFSDRGDCITVTIQDKGNFIGICVQDTGIGIPLDQQQIIFDRFQQVDKSLTRNHEGSGIGLSLVKALVEMHKGQIFLESNYKEGSRFIIEIPVEGVLANDFIPQAHHDDAVQSGRIERIHIEFSDIYS
ncbi:PAS domain S-box protein [Clostridiaceae bacterium 35-E11]